MRTYSILLFLSLCALSELRQSCYAESNAKNEDLYFQKLLENPNQDKASRKKLYYELVEKPKADEISKSINERNKRLAEEEKKSTTNNKGDNKGDDGGDDDEPTQAKSHRTPSPNRSASSSPRSSNPPSLRRGASKASPFQTSPSGRAEPGHAQ